MKTSKPRKTTPARTRRLNLAKHWIVTYTGKNIVRGYAKHYGVDLLCAITELRLLGVHVTTGYGESVKRVLTDCAVQNRKKKGLAENSNLLNDFQNEDFSFIVGYTSGGAPYGARWDDVPEDSDC